MSGSAAPTPTPFNLPSRPPTPEAGSLELLGSYVPQALRRKIALLNSSKKETTISSMFQNAQETSVCALVDLNGFSTLVHDFCEDETDAADLVNDLYSTIVFSVEDYGGDFISIAGDVIICVWKPLFDDPEDEDDANSLCCVQSVKCTLEIMEGVEKNVALKVRHLFHFMLNSPVTFP